jgi:hypothetical protein
MAATFNGLRDRIGEWGMTYQREPLLESMEV